MSLRIVGDYFVWDKGDDITLSPHFKTSEFNCRCKNESCHTQSINKEVISRLEQIRSEVGEPLRITSAFRCADQQRYLRNAGVSTVVAQNKSTHESGDAVDVQVISTKSDRMARLLVAAEKVFKSIGLAKTFLHLDLRDDKIRRWNY